MNRAIFRNLLSAYFESPTTRLLAFLKVTPNTLTTIGLITAVSSGYVISQGYLAIGGMGIIIAGAFDMLDGSLARSINKTTPFGAFLDSIADRFSEIVTLLGILIFFQNNSSTVVVILVYLTLSSSIMVSYVRARAESIGILDKTGLMTRPERIIVLASGLISSHWCESGTSVALAIIFLLSSVTVVQRVLGVRNHLSKLNSSK
jgi:CDP-diacylglycerol--glycerol-3-phosphate 3-phosphatidyltransferase